MNPISSYDVIMERQRDLRRKAQMARTARACGVTRRGNAGRSSMRHGMALTLRRVADTLEPIA